MSKPLILISNDDGVNAPGIHYLIEQVKHLGEIIAVAPDAPRSGQSSAITVNSPLFINEHANYDGVKIYSVTGTPVDCVKMAMHAILPRTPDIMLCGINHGTNAGNCVLYSGTMGAVLEACTIGVPAIGFSLLHHSLKADFSQCGKYVDMITRSVLQHGLPEGICLNVNIPAKCVPKGMKVTRAAKGYWTEEYADYTTPGGRPFYWLTGNFNNLEPGNPETDMYWLDREYVSVVPVNVDQSATGQIPQINDLLK